MHHRPRAAIKLYCSVTEARVRVNDLPRIAARTCGCGGPVRQTAKEILHFYGRLHSSQSTQGQQQAFRPLNYSHCMASDSQTSKCCPLNSKCQLGSHPDAKSARFSVKYARWPQRMSAVFPKSKQVQTGMQCLVLKMTLTHHIWVLGLSRQHRV